MISINLVHSTTAVVVRCTVVLWLGAPATKHYAELDEHVSLERTIGFDHRTLVGQMNFHVYIGI